MQLDRLLGIEGRRMILACRSSTLMMPVRRAAYYAPNGQGFYFPFTEDLDLLTTLHAAGLWIGPRNDLEKMPEYRQIIPYVVMRYQGQFLYYRRSKQGGEDRLHDRYSIGIGGHIDLEDLMPYKDSIDLGATIQYATEREVREELGGVVATSKKLGGLLIDSSDEVGRVHLGVVLEWELADRYYAGLKSPEIAEVGLMTGRQLLDLEPGKLENWSRLLLIATAEGDPAEPRFELVP